MSREQDDPVAVPDRADYDSPWKKALEVYFKEFIDFFFPEMAADLDWSKGMFFLTRNCNRWPRRRLSVAASGPEGLRPGGIRR